MVYITGNHFKDLYNITKEEGISEALKFDLNRTKEDLENLVLGIFGTVIAVPLAVCVTYKVYTKRRKIS